MAPASRWAARALAVAVAALALLPLVSLTLSWAEFRRDVGLPLAETPPPGFDGARWTDGPGGVTAAYVVPRSSAARAGVEPGDRLDAIDFIPVRSATEADRQVARSTGTVLTYSLRRDGQRRTADVRVDRRPTFLYPLSAPLWATAAWGFGVVAFLHLLAYLTVAPLARRSPRAVRAKWLIGAALVWVGVNLARLVWVSVLGAPPAGASVRGAVFDGLTLVALVGWIVYPLLLADQSLRSRAIRSALDGWRWALAVPPVVLGVGVTLATVLGHVGPMPPDAFAVPILFYVCVYVAAATAVVALWPEQREGAAPARWSRVGSAAVMGLSVLGAVVVWTRLGPGPRDEDIRTAWFVVAFQLFSLVPVALVSLSTLRYGPFDVLLARGLGTLATAAAAFGVVVLGDELLDVVLPTGSQSLALGALVVGVLLVAERTLPTLRDWAAQIFETDRQRARRRLDRFGDEVLAILDVETLAQRAVDVVGESLDVRSAVVFLQAGRGTPDERWERAAFRPVAPTFTHAELGRVWDRVRSEGKVWSRNEELNEADLPRGIGDRLKRLGAALAVPVTTGRGVPVGLIVLGRKARRLAVYTTEDVARIRSLAAQLALATERLRLVDRERALVRQTSEAEMAALRAQINPHFLFNALNTVAALVRDRPEQAEATVEHLAALFRDVLNASGQTVVPLRDELRLAQRYLFVEQARFGEALAVEVDADDDVLDVSVPAFSVQTLVENAVKHGIERKRGGGAVTVRARRATVGPDGPAPGALEVVVCDTGVGLPPDGATFGVGLSNVADRLRLLYGDAATLVVTPDEPGARATLRLPL